MGTENKRWNNISLAIAVDDRQKMWQPLLDREKSRNMGAEKIWTTT
jgi:hypothetical protein